MKLAIISLAVISAISFNAAADLSQAQTQFQQPQAWELITHES